MAKKTSFPAKLSQYDPTFFQLISQNVTGAHDDMRKVLPFVCDSAHPFFGKLYSEPAYGCNDHPLSWRDKTCPTEQPLPPKLSELRKAFPQKGMGGCRADELSVIRDGHLCCASAEPWMTPEILTLNHKLFSTNVTENTIDLDSSLVLSPTRLEELATIVDRKLEQDTPWTTLLAKIRRGDFDTPDDDITLDTNDQDLSPEMKKDVRDMDEHEEKEETLEQFVVNHAFRDLGLASLKGHETKLKALYDNERKRGVPSVSSSLGSFPSFLDRVEKQLHEKWAWVENRALNKKSAR